MKKIILGIIIGFGLTIGVTAYASSGIIHVDKLEALNYQYVYKYYDQNNDVVCYTVGDYRGGISCLKNK